MTNKINWEKVHNSDKKYTPVPKDLVDSIIKNSNNPKTALDIGCGKGDLLIKLAEKGLMVSGIDISDTALKKAEEKFESLSLKAELIKADFNKPEFTSQIIKKTFDIIIIRLSFAFVDDKDRFCKEIKKVMNSDSIFICSTPILLDGPEYNGKQKRISIKKEYLEKVLNNNFNHVSLLLENELDRKNWPLSTYLCKK